MCQVDFRHSATWVVGVAKAGLEEGSDFISGTCIVAPSGEIVAMASTRDDKLITFRCGLDLARHNKETMFNFALNREPQAYGLITEWKAPEQGGRTLLFGLAGGQIPSSPMCGTSVAGLR